jgi:hypothetical protein
MIQEPASSMFSHSRDPRGVVLEAMIMTKLWAMLDAGLGSHFPHSSSRRSELKSNREMQR